MIVDYKLKRLFALSGTHLDFNDIDKNNLYSLFDYILI